MNGVIATWMLMAMLNGAPSDGRWHDDYTRALTAARADRKPLLVVMHNPAQPQQALKQVGYAKPDASTLLENYHLCEIDVSTEHGKRVAGVFRAKQFPYTVITDRSAEKIILRKNGAFSDTQWTEILADYRRGSRPVSMAAFNTPARSTGSFSSSPDFCPT